MRRDTVERKRTEERLRRSEAEYRALIEHAPYGIYRSTTPGRFVTVNRALVQMLGYESEADLLQLDLATDLYVDPDARGRLIELFRTVEHLEGVEFEWRRRDGRVITVRLAGRAVVVPQGNPQLFEMMAEDVTEMRRLQLQVCQSQKLEAIGTLAGGVAHDFNNLLTVIGGYSEFLLERLAPQDPARGDVLEIKKAAERGTAITQQLLAFSRQQVLRPHVSDLNAVIAGVDRMLRRLIGEQIELDTLAGSDRAHIRVDPIQIEQVIMNLAINARDAMPDGGKLTIQTTDAKLDNTDPRRSFRVVPGPYVMLAVSDTGCGMDAETQTRIFEPFFTTKERGKGTGLGLSTAYGIVKQSGGYIWVDSAPGRGTIFRIYLPKVEDEIEEGHAHAAGAAPQGSETVLLVEDDEPVRKSVRRALEARGFNVLEAARGEEAILIEQQHEGPIHVLLTDSVMPGLSGREVARRLLLVRPQIRVVFMSGYSDDAALRHGVLPPNEAFLQKPFGPDAVARTVREVLDTTPLP